MAVRPATSAPDLRVLQWLSASAAVCSFALVVWGGIVRLAGAGMTCPDWPRCRGVWVPQLDNPVVYEWVHRLGAPVLTVLILACVGVAWFARLRSPAALGASLAAVGMVVAQIVVGAITIFRANDPPSVAAHLVVGIGTFCTLALLAWIAANAGAERRDVGPPPRWFQALALGTTLAAFAAIFAAGFMSASHDGGACRGLPLCNGWSGATTEAARIHMDHRWAAYATFALIVAVVAWAMRRRRERPDIAAVATIVGALAIVQVLLGMATVASGLAVALRSIHQAVGALLACGLCVLSYVSFVPVAWPAEQTARVLRDYLALTKPRVMSLLLFTTLASMVIAQRGMPSAKIVLITLLGGALAAAAAAAINMYVDRDIDAKMGRTALRPLPGGRIAPTSALLFGVILGALAFATLSAFVNLLTAMLAIAGILYYVLIYTVWLKRITPQNIVIGGAAGSVPPLVGWAAVTGHLGVTALLLFLIVFIWTPPHFWALALLAKDQYAGAGVPMLPVVRGEAETKRQIVWYSVALAGLTLAAVPLRLMGPVYLAAVAVLDALFLYYAVRVARDGGARNERALYKFSMAYLALLFVAMALDSVARGASI